MKNLQYLLIAFFLFSCGSKVKKLHIVFEDANGLVEGNPVLIKEIQIGKVSNISLNKLYKINVEISLNDTIQLPKDTKFVIGSKDLFTKAIFVTPGKLKLLLSDSDKIIGQKEQNLNLEFQIKFITRD